MEIIYTDEFGEWFEDLSEAQQDSVGRIVDLLEARGVALTFPHSSEIKGSKIALRELRTRAEDHPLRIFYAFDPVRDAVLLIGGDKKGDDRFYERVVPLAEKIWAAYLNELKQK